MDVSTVASNSTAHAPLNGWLSTQVCRRCSTQATAPVPPACRSSSSNRSKSIRQAASRPTLEVLVDHAAQQAGVLHGVDLHAEGGVVAHAIKQAGQQAGTGLRGRQGIVGRAAHCMRCQPPLHAQPVPCCVLPCLASSPSTTPGTVRWRTPLPGPSCSSECIR